MIIVDFSKEHILKANALALACYDEECCQVPVLPKVDQIPDLTYFADNGMGVAAFDQGDLVGFLCSTAPFEQAFDSTDVKGVFSPVHANAAVSQNCAKIYAAMYQEAARKWVYAGAVSHSICFYAHNEIAQMQFFKYGFGMRCIDAIRPMETISCNACDEYEFKELTSKEFDRAYPFYLLLNKHYYNSPFFMNRNTETCEEFLETCVTERDRCFIAQYDGEPCAYIKISESGETFLTEHEHYRHVTGAYCIEKHRGKAVIQNLLNYIIRNLQAEGFTQLGVDFESINPTAYGFWSKYFTAYTHSLVRRIDERILKVDRYNQSWYFVP